MHLEPTPAAVVAGLLEAFSSEMTDTTIDVVREAETRDCSVLKPAPDILPCRQRVGRSPRNR
jgi:hypothetical protein